MSDRIDLLDRGAFIENVIKVVDQLSENRKGCCFAIEGRWGVGKTFVIEEVEDRLKETQSEEVNTDKYFVFHYNCWQHDYYEEPAVAIISAMIASLQKNDIIASENVNNTVKAGYELAVDKLKEIAGTFIENKIGVNLISLADKIKEKKEEAEKSVFEFDELFNFSKTIEKARKSLQEIAEQRTIVLVVDELDRCIPQYAIKILERLHHIFYGLENVVVIMAIDRKQLEHSVEEMFGTKNDDGSMDIEKYLKKFIDFSMVLDYGTINESIKEKYKFYFDKFEVSRDSDNENVNKILTMLLSEVDIRRQEKIMEKANLVHSLICSDKMDISVLVFEVMYEVLRLCGYAEMNYILDICNYGTNKSNEILKHIFEAAYEEHIDHFNRVSRYILDNLYGDVYAYFWSIFHNSNDIPIIYTCVKESKRELEIAKKYCEFCKIIN